ncbi:MAG: hypothetical protein EA347_00030 [Thioalkalivibrio sp.]|nr:MAG: hypothetical protein EA347_00030 [Thioalkalivibrio sp.]
MQYWKALVLSAFLFPAMAVAQQAEEEGAEQEMFLTSLDDEQMLANNLLGSPVHAQITGVHEEEMGAPDQPGMAAGEDTVGTVDDVVLGLDGEVIGIVVGVGGFLGIGERDVAIAWEEIDVQADPERPGAYVVRTDLDRQTLEDAPEFHHERNGIF